jgi:Tfp pilus assembly protein PilX
MRPVRHPAQEEKGIALLITVLLLLVVTVLGVNAMRIGSSESQFSGSYRRAEGSFYAADGGLSWVRTVNTYFQGVNQNWPVGGTPACPVSAAGTITPDGFGPPPLNSGSSAVYFQSQFYQVVSVGTDAGSAQSSIQARVSQTVPR